MRTSSHNEFPGLLRYLGRCLATFGLAILLQPWPPCWAGEAAESALSKIQIEVPEEVSVSDKRLKLIDFVEPAQIPESFKASLVGIDIGSAPEAGRELYLASQQLRQPLEKALAAQGLDPGQTTIVIPDRIRVLRRQSQVTQEQLEGLFREFVLKKAPWKTDDLVIGQISFSSLPALPAGNLRIEATAGPNERFLGEVNVTLHFFVDGKEIRNMRVSGKVELQQEVVQTVRAMKRNEIVTEADIQLVRTNITARPERYLTLREHAVGKKLLSSIGPNQPLGPRDLQQPSLIRRGDPVTMVYQQEGVRLSMRGEARENGGQGDRIRIKNLESKKNILCQVVDPQTVEVIP